MLAVLPQMRTNTFATVAVGVLVLAGLAVAVSSKSATAGVLGASGMAFSNVIRAAAYGSAPTK